MATDKPTTKGPKTRPTDASVDAFIDGVADPVRRADCRVLATLMSRVTGEPAVMWGEAIIGFGSCPVRYANGSSLDWPEVAFSPRKGDLTLYLLPEFAGREALLAALGRHKLGKSCLYVRSLGEVQLPALEALVEASVRATRAGQPSC